jgi:hypothetical protein
MAGDEHEGGGSHRGGGPAGCAAPPGSGESRTGKQIREAERFAVRGRWLLGQPLGDARFHALGRDSVAQGGEDLVDRLVGLIVLGAHDSSLGISPANSGHQSS